MLYVGPVAPGLPLLVVQPPFLSLAVIAAITVLLWEARGLFSRRGGDARPVHASGGAASMVPAMRSDESDESAGGGAALAARERVSPAAVPAPRRRARGGDMDRLLVVAGAVIIALAVVWLLARAARGRA